MGLLTFRQVPDTIPFAARDAHRSIAFRNRMIIVGGRSTGPAYRNDVWESQNGRDWSQLLANGNSELPNISSFGMCEHDERMYLCGGLTDAGTGYLGTVYSSTNGIDWRLITSAPGWGARYDCEILSYDGRIWLFGGDEGGTLRNDVWCSQNGLNWTRVLASGHTFWTPRYDHKVCVYDNKMWLIGGYDANGGCSDSWYTQDGRKWIQANTACAFGAIYNHSLVAWKEMQRMVVIAGTVEASRGVGTGVGQIWHSQNGVQWDDGHTCEFGAISEHSCVSFNNRLWVVGGTDVSGDSNKVWYTEGKNLRV